MKSKYGRPRPLPDWWWLHNHRRWGQKYTVPFSMTLLMLWRRWVRRKDVRWYIHGPYRDGGVVYTASITERLPGYPSGGGVGLSGLPRSMMRAEWKVRGVRTWWWRRRMKAVP